jgi:hypothetical protein
MRLTEPATITTPNRYDKKAWESTVPRIRGSRTVVSAITPSHLPIALRIELLAACSVPFGPVGDRALFMA